MEEQSRAKRFWGAIGQACAFFGVYLGAQIAVSSALTVAFTIISVMRTGEYNESAITEMLNSSIMELTLISNAIAIVLCLLLASIFRKKHPIEAIDLTLSFDKKPLTLGACAFLGVVGQIAILFLLNIIPFPESWTAMLEENNSQIASSGVVVEIISVAIMAPLAEEIIFRAGIQGSLKRGMPRWWAIALSALIFGVMHGNPIGIIYASALGIMMGWIYSKFDSIIPSMVFHLAFNTMSLIVSLFDGIPFIICIISCALFASCIAFIARIPNTSKGENNNDQTL